MSNTVRFVVASLFVTAAASADPPPPPPHHGPPPEAFTACESKAKGDACSVTFGDRTIAGTCEGPPPGVSDTRLACRPSGPPPSR